jgi:uncharacterized coiled-coil protein SlyX
MDGTKVGFADTMINSLNKRLMEYETYLKELEARINAMFDRIWRLEAENVDLRKIATQDHNIDCVCTWCSSLKKPCSVHGEPGMDVFARTGAKCPYCQRGPADIRVTKSRRSLGPGNTRKPYSPLRCKWTYAAGWSFKRN